MQVTYNKKVKEQKNRLRNLCGIFRGPAAEVEVKH